MNYITKNPSVDDAKRTIEQISPRLRAEIDQIFAAPGYPVNRLILIARLARHDPRVAIIVRALIPLQLVSDSDQEAVEAELERVLPDHPAPTVQQELEAKRLIIRIDPEIARICVALRLDPLLRLWAILKHYGASSGGKLPKDVLYEHQERLGIGYSRRHVNRLVAQGRGLFWHEGQGNLYLIGSVKLSWNVIALAHERDQGSVVGTNPPGVRDMYIPVNDGDGDIEQFRAHVYAAWIAHRENPTISRERLQVLFNRGLDTLLRWERQRLSGRLRVRRNYAQAVVTQDTAHDLAGYIPNKLDNPSVRDNYDWHGETLVTWQIPNSYHVSNYRQAERRGQASMRRNIVVRRTCERPAHSWSEQDPQSCSDYGADHSDQRTGGQRSRLYFDDEKQFRRWQNRRQRHHKGDIRPNVGRAGYVWRGENRRGFRVWELTVGEPVTTSESRARGRVAWQFRADHRARLYRAMGKLKGTKIRPPTMVFGMTTRNYSAVSGRRGWGPGRG